MDIDAALKDGYSLAEVNAEAARRVGFNYAAALNDGYSDDEINAELRKRLNKTSAPKIDIKQEMADVKQRGENWLENLQGVAETGGSLITGALGGVAGIPVAAVQNVREMMAGKPSDFMGEYARAQQRMTLEPKTELGKELTSGAGDIINRYVLPGAAVFDSIPGAGPAIRAVAGGLGNTLARVGKQLEGKPSVRQEVPTPISGVLNELKDETTATEPTRGAGAFDQMRRDLGGPEPTPAPTPMGQMADTLLRREDDAAAALAEQRARVIQEQLDARQAELEQAVKRQQTLDFNASERARQEAASAVSEAHMAYEQAKREAADSELAQRAQQGVQEEMFGNPELFDLASEGEMGPKIVPELPTKQGELFEPQTNMYRDYTDMRVDNGLGGERPLTPREFQQVLENLSKEEGTRMAMPENMQEAYQNYLNSISDKQGGLFDVGSRQEAFAGSIFEQQLPTKVAAHPSVRNATKKVEKQRKFVSDLKEQIAAGETKATALMGEMKALRELEAKLETARANVEAGLRRGSPYKGEVKLNAMMPDDFLKKFPGFGKSVLRDDAGQLKVFYTGTSKDKHFNDVKTGPRGAWFTDDPAAASSYARENDSRNVKYDPDTRRYKEVNTAERVLPVYLNVENPYRLSPEDTAKYRVAENYAKFQKELTAKAKAAGHDAIDWGDGVISVFDAKNIKSAIAPEVKTPKVIEMNAGLKLPWSKTKELDVIKNIPGLGDNLKDIGVAGIKSADEAIALAKEAPDVSQGLLSKATNIFTKGGRYLKGKVNNPVVHFTVDTMLDAHNVARGTVNQKVHGEYLTVLRVLSKQEFNDAFTLLNAADLAQKPLTAELMEKHGVSTNVQRAVLTHQKLMKEAIDNINASRVAVGLNPIKERIAYSAMNMSGDFRKVVTKDGEVVGVIGANTKSIGKHSLEKLEADLKAKDPTLEFGPLQDMSSRNGFNRGTPSEAFMDVFEALGENNPNIAEFTKVLREVAASDPANYMGMQKHTMAKKGVWGMEGRKTWLSAEENAKAFFENQIKYLENAFSWGELSRGAAEVNKVLRDETVMSKQQKAIQLADDYLSNALGINPSKIGTALDNFISSLGKPIGIGPSIPRSAVHGARVAANTLLLSINPAFLGIQLVQAPTVMPGITALLRGRDMAPGSTWVTQGLAHFAEGGLTLLKDQLGQKLSAVETGAFAYAKKHHVYATDMVEHANQVRKGVGYYTTKATQSPAAIVEQATRAQVYFGLVKMMEEAGLTPKDGLYQQAHHFTDMAMGNYSAIEKPQFYNALGPIGSMAYNLRTFSHNELSRWSLYAREIGKTGNPIPLATQMATTIALAGVMGLPFFSQWEELYKYITTNILKQPRSLAMDVMEMSKKMAPDMQYALSHGVASYLGVDASKRFGLGQIAPENVADAVMPGGSKLLDIAGSAINLAKNPNESAAKALAYNVAPSGFQGLLDTAWYQKGNISYSKDPNAIKPTGERNELDTKLRKWGLTGIQESVGKTREYELRQIDVALGEFRKKGLNSMADAIIRGKPFPDSAVVDYFQHGQGDPKSFKQVLDQLAQRMNMTPAQLAKLQQSASKSYTQMIALQRRTQ